MIPHSTKNKRGFYSRHFKMIYMYITTEQLNVSRKRVCTSGMHSPDHNYKNMINLMLPGSQAKARNDSHCPASPQVISMLAKRSLDT
jgi:hypothetical protein